MTKIFEFSATTTTQLVGPGLPGGGGSWKKFSTQRPKKYARG